MEYRRKKIVGYENYEVDTEGNVYSMNYGRTGKEQKLKPGKNKGGYLHVSLCKEGKQKMFLVHRLVANAFVPNLERKSQVNHKNEQKDDNRVSNLEWMTRLENCNYGTRNERCSGSNHGKAKPKEYYSTKTTKRTNFKIICKRQDWNFDDFTEIDSGEKCGKIIKYYYNEVK